MPTIHTATRLAKSLTKQLDPTALGDPDSPLDCFYADTFNVERRRCWVVVHDPTGYIVLLPGMTAGRVADVGRVLAKALLEQLAYDDIELPQELSARLRDHTALGRTHGNRRLVGNLNEARHTLDHHRAQHPSFATFPWVRIAGYLNTLLIKPPPGYAVLSRKPYCTAAEFIVAHLGQAAQPPTVHLPSEIALAIAAPEVSRADQYEAQQHFYGALESSGGREEDRFLQLSLKQDPRNVDALLVTLSHRPAREQTSTAYAHLVDLTRERLGDDFEIYRGGFWGFLETHPYMRARAGLAGALLKDGKWPSARDHYLALFDLNPNDNQGIRYVLAPLLLKNGELAHHRRLVAAYPGDVEAR